MYHAPDCGRKSVSPTPTPPRYVRFVSPTIVGQANDFSLIGGDDPTLHGWAGVMAACDMGAVPMRSSDGLTLFLFMDPLTAVNWWGRA